MNLLSVPDIAAMLILMGVLNRLRRKHRDSSVDLWMLGLTFILLEAIAVAVLRSSPAFNRAAHAIALDSYILAAVTFGWASREDRLPVAWHPPVFFPPALPLLLLATMYGFNAGTTQTYVYLCSLTLAVGACILLLFASIGWRKRILLLGVHLALWGPMIWMAYTGNLRMLVYWGLTCLYLLVAFSFRKLLRNDGIGGLVIVTGFVVWALCFFAHPLVRDSAYYYDLDEEIWTMQKFFVIIGMLLVLLEDQTRRLSDDAMHDPLTGLPNRRLFQDRLSQALSRAHRTGLSAAVFLVDLDKFKQINDTYGHRTGDVVLVRVGSHLKAKIRSSDTLARCGGDEFNVIVNDLARPEDCERIAETLRAAIEAVELPPETPSQLTASIGYALYPNDVSDGVELCELADVRMYRDKRMRSAMRPAEIQVPAPG
jgi:diguanylate cyclase (GGDEF)-like protein